jgi:hypothetical protein
MLLILVKFHVVAGESWSSVNSEQIQSLSASLSLELLKFHVIAGDWRLKFHVIAGESWSAEQGAGPEPVGLSFPRAALPNKR